MIFNIFQIISKIETKDYLNIIKVVIETFQIWMSVQLHEEEPWENINWESVIYFMSERSIEINELHDIVVRLFGLFKCFLIFF